MNSDEIKNLLGTHMRDQAIEGAVDFAEVMVAFYSHCRNALPDNPEGERVAISLTIGWVKVLMGAAGGQKPCG